MKKTSKTPGVRVPGIPFQVPAEAAAILKAAPKVTLATSVHQLVEFSVKDADATGWQHVGYEVPGRGFVPEAKVCRVKNGIAANYPEAYMRRRDPDCMVIGDSKPTDKPTYREWFGCEFDGMRSETFEWLSKQPVAVFAFHAGGAGKSADAMVIAPDNAGFFALGLAQLQGILAPGEIPADFNPRVVIYVAPPFRHTHFKGKQIVVHNRLDDGHELFSYNLYPGPSAKKGIYGVLLTVGEQENWITTHCSTALVTSPYDNKIVITHEGASGGGKSEMLEHPHRQRDGSLLLGRNLVTGEERTLTLPRTCDVRPVTDDMALCHPSLDKGRGKLSLMDAENAWFMRVNHITRYGIDPHMEELTTHPSEPLLFLNIDAQPGATALIWEHIMDAPGKPCPNPRVVIPRHIIPDVVDGSVEVDIRSFGVRCPPCTKAKPTYGIIGLMHVLPPALAWLWRLVAPRGHANPSIVSSEGMSSEGVGSYWPFATGRRVDQANLLLDQMVKTPEVRYLLLPNQHVGSWEVSFMPQWIAREYLTRRGGARFRRSTMKDSRCALLGYTPGKLTVENREIGDWLFEVDSQPEVGPEAYDAGAALLQEFFESELRQFLVPELHPLGRSIIECCLNKGSLADYEKLLPGHETLIEGE